MPVLALRELEGEERPRGEGDRRFEFEEALAVERADHYLTILERQAGMETGAIGIVPLIESAVGILNCREICAASPGGVIFPGDASELVDLRGTDGGTAADYRLELGSGSFIKGFEEQLEGAKNGDKVEVKVTFPENYGSAELAGKDAVFAVTVKDILQSEAPEANDEFAKTLGFEDLAKLKEAISKQIEDDFASLAKVKLKKELFDKLDSELNFAVPEGMVDLEYNSLLKNDKRICLMLFLRVFVNSHRRQTTPPFYMSGLHQLR